MKQVEVVWHDVIETPLTNGQFRSSLGQEHHATFKCDTENQRIYCDDKYISFRHDFGCGFAYQVRKTFIRSLYELDEFWKEFFDDEFWYSFQRKMAEHIRKYGKTA